MEYVLRVRYYSEPDRILEGSEAITSLLEHTPGQYSREKMSVSRHPFVVSKSATETAITIGPAQIDWREGALVELGRTVLGGEGQIRGGIATIRGLYYQIGARYEIRFDLRIPSDCGPIKFGLANELLSEEMIHLLVAQFRMQPVQIVCNLGATFDW